MRYLALATDYDGTLAHDGRVDDDTLAGLRRFHESGRSLVLVTGRELDDLLHLFPQADLFDRVVAENGALVYTPETRSLRAVGQAPPADFIRVLRERGVTPLSVGRVIVSTRQPHETTVVEVIRDSALELQVIFNKGAVMILPSGINKAVGLRNALADLGLSPHNVVGIGDAENDHAFLAECEAAAVVANALPILKERADLVTAGSHGAGVTALIDALLASDLRELGPQLRRHRIPIGVREDGTAIEVEPDGCSIVLTGPSEGGKSTLATTFLERLADRGRQVCIVDPEGDYETFERAVSLGDAKKAPSAEEVLAVLQQADRNVSANLLAVRRRDRPAFFQALLARLVELRARTGRPHWLVLDEAHHLLPAPGVSEAQGLAGALTNTLLVTLQPADVARSALARVNAVAVVGPGAAERIRECVAAVGASQPDLRGFELDPGEAAWAPASTGFAPQRFQPDLPEGKRRRHQRKYAQGDLGPDRSFYFRGARDTLRLRAGNLDTFLELAEGVDDETWRFHLERGDYSRWFREGVKDDGLASDAAAVEAQRGPPRESRQRIREAIESRYTASDTGTT